MAMEKKTETHDGREYSHTGMGLVEVNNLKAAIFAAMREIEKEANKHERLYKSKLDRLRIYDASFSQSIYDVSFMSYKSYESANNIIQKHLIDVTV
jgi:hypothetical protein